MKVWLSNCDLNSYLDDSNVKFGIGWYKHHRSHKWKGLTIEFYLYKWILMVNMVDNYAEYQKRIRRK